MTLSRRKLMLAGIGATQLGLLSRYNLFDGLLGGRARAAEPTDRPTKLLTIYVPGGIHHEFLWASFFDSTLSRFMPPPERMPGVFYDSSRLSNLDGSGNADFDAPIRRLRTHITWNQADPTDRSMGEPNNKGYVWAAPDYSLYENVAIIHGVDQGTAAHESGIVSSMCGIAGANFTAPSLPARIANHFVDAFPDRAIPSVTFGGFRAPAVTLPARANAAGVVSLSDLEFTLSDRRRYWEGLRERQESPTLGFDGLANGETASQTVIDRAILETIRTQRFRSTEGMDVALNQLYDTYSSISRTIARNIVDILEATPGVQYLPSVMPWTPSNPRFGWQLGYADFYATDQLWINEFDLALRFLKSDLTTSVSFQMFPTINFDSHYSNPYPSHSVHLRGVFESIGRFLCEMKLTPSPTRSDRTLLDDTLVYITSEFGRSLPITGGSDHNPIHSAVLVNGLIHGNRMIGGIAEGGLGAPVSVTEESGDRTTRPPTARDVAATLMACFGIEGAEAFLPGGYGVVEGVVPT